MSLVTPIGSLMRPCLVQHCFYDSFNIQGSILSSCSQGITLTRFTFSSRVDIFYCWWLFPLFPASTFDTVQVFSYCVPNAYICGCNATRGFTFIHDCYSKIAFIEFVIQRFFQSQKNAQEKPFELLICFVNVKSKTVPLFRNSHDLSQIKNGQPWQYCMGTKGPQSRVNVYVNVHWLTSLKVYLLLMTEILVD